MIRDQEIRRLVNYARALGCKIINKVRTRNDPAALWTATEGESSTITIFTKRYDSKTYIILTLIHELAHLKSHINNNRKVSNAMSRISTEYWKRKKHPEWVRRTILNEEMNDLKYWDEIVRECDIRINPKRIEYQKELDILHYEYYYLLDDNPPLDELDDIKRAIKKRIYGK